MTSAVAQPGDGCAASSRSTSIKAPWAAAAAGASYFRSNPPPEPLALLLPSPIFPPWLRRLGLWCGEEDASAEQRGRGGGEQFSNNSPRVPPQLGLPPHCFLRHFFLFDQRSACISILSIHPPESPQIPPLPRPHRLSPPSRPFACDAPTAGHLVAQSCLGALGEARPGRIILSGCF